MQSFLSGALSREDYLRDRDEQADFVQRALDLAGDHAVFEIGSGEGVVVARLAPLVWSVTCVDISEAFLRRARATCDGISNVEFLRTDNGHLAELRRSGFDRGYSWNVFIHLDAYQVYHYLCGVARALRPDGLFAFNYITMGDQTRSLFHTFAGACPTCGSDRLLGFLRWYEPALMISLAHEAGLVPVAQYGVGGSKVMTLQLPAGTGDDD